MHVAGISRTESLVRTAVLNKTCHDVWRLVRICLRCMAGGGFTPFRFAPTISEINYLEFVWNRSCNSQRANRRHQGLDWSRAWVDSTSCNVGILLVVAAMESVTTMRACERCLARKTLQVLVRSGSKWKRTHPLPLRERSCVFFSLSAPFCRVHHRICYHSMPGGSLLSPHGLPLVPPHFLSRRD